MACHLPAQSFARASMFTLAQVKTGMVWAAGADGLYLWNYQYIDPLRSPGWGRLHPATFRSGLSEISAPSSLDLLSKHFPVSSEQLEQVII